MTLTAAGSRRHERRADMTLLRLGTVPDTHPYIDAVLPSSVRHVQFAPATRTGWEPSPLLRAEARRSCLAKIDALHVHFGYESLTADQLEHFVTDVRSARVGLVVTVHDLRNPHDRDRGAHDRHLSSLLNAADAVLSLTSGAAAEVTRRWSRPVTVTSHPSLLLEAAPAHRRAHRRTVGIHLKSLRANVVDPIALVRAAADGARAVGALVRVDVHDPGAPPALLAALAEVAVEDSIDVHAHERFSDAELIDYLSGLDVSVLPYQFGTHSGWLELCRDLGVTVIAPDCGYYAEQWPATHTYSNNERTGLDATSLRRAVISALSRPRLAPADRVSRVADRDQARLVHADIYAQVTQCRVAR
jgi:hypothetical protein